MSKCPVAQAWYFLTSHMPALQLISGFSEKVFRLEKERDQKQKLTFKLRLKNNKLKNFVHSRTKPITWGQCKILYAYEE